VRKPDINSIRVFETIEGGLEVVPRGTKEYLPERGAVALAVSNYSLDAVARTDPSVPFESCEKHRKQQPKETN